RGLHLIEVFPALALASLEQHFFGRLKGPRYNPSRRNTFKIEDWRAVIAAARNEAMRFGCTFLSEWLDQLATIGMPKRTDQDRLDAPPISFLLTLELTCMTVRSCCDDGQAR